MDRPATVHAFRHPIAMAVLLLACAPCPANGVAEHAGGWEVVDAEGIEDCPATGLCVVHSRSRYLIEGRSDRALASALTGAGSASAHALTDFGVILSYELHPGSDGCRIERIGLRLEIDMQLPHLVDDVKGSADRRRNWRQAREGLSRHERGHVDLAYEHAGNVLAVLHALPPAADCRRARRAAGREYMRQSMRHSLAQQLYDLRTDSGARQGAIIALPQSRHANANFRWR